MIESIEDVRTHLSGVSEREWGGKASFDGLVQFAFRHSKMPMEVYSSIPSELIDEIIIDYLVSVGEKPEEYGF